MAQRYIVLVYNSVYDSNCPHGFDDITDAKQFAEDTMNLGQHAVIYEAVYDYDPEKPDLKPESNTVYSEPWGWLK